MNIGIIRTFLFYLCLTGWTIIIGIGMLPLAIINRDYAIYTSYIWAKYSIKLVKLILKINYRLQGEDNIPIGNCIIASNHQSAWETIFFLYYFKNPIFILKKELFYLPIIGLYCKRIGMVFIDRKKPHNAIKKLKKSFAKEDDRKIIIFPEGTRVSYMKKSAFKSGITFISKNLGLSIIPSAHNAGKFWPKGFGSKSPGTIKIKFLTPIAYFGDKNNLIKTLENNIYSSIE